MALISAISCQPAAEPPTPPTVRIALHGDPSNLDPHLQSEVIALAVLGNIYESLVAFGPNMRIKPELATTWSNPSDLVWRFKLRPDVYFHDGRPLTVEDVLASIERIRHHPRSQQAGSLVAVESARKVDASTVELVTNRPYPILLNRLAFVAIVPADAPEQITRPVGTGPYRFLTHEPGRAELEAVTDHWRVSGQPRRAEYYFVADSIQRSQGLLGGKYDLVDDLAAEDIAIIEAAADLRIESHSSQSVAFIQLDVDEPPFDDPRVRRALSLAVDRHALVSQLHGGHALPVAQMVSPNVFGYLPTLEPPRQDLEAARSLLAEAGYPDGLEVELEVRSGREDIPLLRRQLARAGIRLHAVERPWSEMYPRLTARQVGNYLGAWVCTSGDAGDVLDRKLHSRDPERGYGDSNFNDSSNPQLDELIEASNAMRDLEARQELLQQALELAAHDMAYLPLYSLHEVYGVDRQLRWSPRSDGRVYAYEARWTAEPGDERPP